jgi:hypothetical protein
MPVSNYSLLLQSEKSPKAFHLNKPHIEKKEGTKQKSDEKLAPYISDAEM